MAFFLQYRPTERNQAKNKETDLQWLAHMTGVARNLKKIGFTATEHASIVITHISYL